MKPEARSRRLDLVQARPLEELLKCPPEAGSLLSSAAECIDFYAGEMVFGQSTLCRGLYLVVSGRFVRRTDRMHTHLSLGPARPGDLVELAAALGDRKHTYTLTAQSAGSVMLLPMEALSDAFELHPPLRMQLLEELAREVSRAYLVCCLSGRTRTRHRESAKPAA